MLGLLYSCRLSYNCRTAAYMVFKLMGLFDTPGHRDDTHGAAQGRRHLHQQLRPNPHPGPLWHGFESHRALWLIRTAPCPVADTHGTVPCG